MNRLKNEKTDAPDILLADSKKVSREMVRRLLQIQGYKVVTAEDGQEAAGILREHDFKFRLVITETSMPFITGFDLIKMIKDVSNVPVLVLSASGDEQTVSEIFRLRADDFIKKPFLDMELLQRVRQLLSFAVQPKAVTSTGSSMVKDLVEVIKEKTKRTAVHGGQMAMRLAG